MKKWMKPLSSVNTLFPIIITWKAGVMLNQKQVLISFHSTNYLSFIQNTSFPDIIVKMEWQHTGL